MIIGGTNLQISPCKTKEGLNESDNMFQSPKKKLLGDFTLYKVNKELDNFWLSVIAITITFQVVFNYKPIKIQLALL